MPNSPKIYLGDGVYAGVDRGILKLWTEDGITVTNIIFLEMEVWQALETFVSKLKEQSQ